MIPAELAQIKEILLERVGSVDEGLALRIYNDWVDLSAENRWHNANPDYPTLEAIINRYLAEPDYANFPF